MRPSEKYNIPFTTAGNGWLPRIAMMEENPETTRSFRVDRDAYLGRRLMNADMGESMASKIDFSTTSAHEYVDVGTIQPIQTSTCIGVPESKPFMTLKDALTVIGCLIAFIAALVTVFDATLAIRLGQANQLIIVGFLLAIMAFCLSTEVIPTLVAYEASSSNATLQNLEGISRLQFTGQHIQSGYRAIILLVLALPVALSIGYKTFQDGSSQGASYTSIGTFGTVGPPGTLGIGWGLSLFINATLPWFSDPGFNRTYGFNTYVQSENVTAMLDGPLPAQVAQIQSQLKSDESMNITAEVLAIVGSLDSSLDDSAENLAARWETGLNQTIKPWASVDWVWYWDCHLGLMTVSAMNVSKWWVSRWSYNANTTEDQSFASGVRQYSLFQQRYHGIWTITPGSVALVSASPIADTVVNHPVIIENQDTTIIEVYHTPYTEFDYRFLDEAYGSPPNETKISDRIKTDATLLSSMVWSRLAALDGPFTNYENFHTQTQYTAAMSQQKSRTTLRRSGGLVVILAINPVLVVASLFLRTAAFYDSPVTNGFGVTSLLAAACNSNSEILRGAALSGILEKSLSLRFIVTNEQDLDYQNSDHQSPRLKVIFGDSGKSVRLRRKVKYR